MQIIRSKKLKQIFSDHWKTFTQKHPGQIRSSIQKNVDKMLRCGTEEMGFHLYQCPACKEEKKVPHTCKSRFCSSCGVAQTKRWIEQYEVLFANTAYRHLIFHPPSEFRPYFGLGKNRYYNMLYKTVSQTLKDWYSQKGYLPGIMAVMHTFGRDEKFTPHIHVLMTSGGLNKTETEWTSHDFLPYVFFKKHFKQHFLENIQELWKQEQLEKIPEKLRFLLTPLYQNKIVQKLLTMTWYVYIGEKLSNAFFTVKYIARYTKRPPIAEGRINDYDGCSVTFNFVDHKTEKHTVLTLPAEEFIGLLIRHIPDENFRIVRYYGCFSHRLRGILLPKVFVLLGQNYAKAKNKLQHLGSWWRRQLTLFTKLDPLICSVCFVPLELISVVYAASGNSTYG